jgi:hypothetical protein
MAGGSSLVRHEKNVASASAVLTDAPQPAPVAFGSGAPVAGLLVGRGSLASVRRLDRSRRRSSRRPRLRVRGLRVSRWTQALRRLRSSRLLLAAAPTSIRRTTTPSTAEDPAEREGERRHQNDGERTGRRPPTGHPVAGGLEAQHRREPPPLPAADHRRTRRVIPEGKPNRRAGAASCRAGRAGTREEPGHGDSASSGSQTVP